MPARDELCRCGHGRELHDHLRRGTDCAECGAQRCRAYRATGAQSFGRVRNLVARLVPRRSGGGVVLQYRSKAARGRAGTTPVADEAKRRDASGDVAEQA